MVKQKSVNRELRNRTVVIQRARFTRRRGKLGMLLVTKDEHGKEYRMWVKALV